MESSDKEKKVNISNLSHMKTLDDTASLGKCLLKQINDTNTDFEKARHSINVIEHQVSELLDLVPSIRKAILPLSDVPPQNTGDILNSLNQVIQELCNAQCKAENLIHLLDEYINNSPKIFKWFNLLNFRTKNNSEIRDLKSLLVQFEQKNSTESENLQEVNDIRKHLSNVVNILENFSSKANIALGNTREFLARAEKIDYKKEIQNSVNSYTLTQEHLNLSSISAKKFTEQTTCLIDNLKLLGSLVSAKPNLEPYIESNYQEFKQLLFEFYKEAKKDNYPAEAQASMGLEEIQSKLNRIRIAPQLSTKNIIAVAGGVSSGKSSFINSLLGEESHLLPTDITPSTAIPTYVNYITNKSLEISLFNKNGGKTQINEKKLKLVSHKYEEFFGIPLNFILDRIVISTSKLKKWDRISFVDTPGYTTSVSDEFIRSDSDITLNEVLTSHNLIWVVDCEKGTLTETDISYIKKFIERGSRFDSQPCGDIYIVINKADKKPPSQRIEILEHIKQLTEEKDIRCLGIGMYSARSSRWYDYVDTSFEEFLNELNCSQPYMDLKKNVNQILIDYIDYHHSSTQQIETRISKLKQIETVGVNVFMQSEISNLISEYCKDLELERENHNTHASTYDALQKRFEKCLGRFFQ